MIEQFGGLTIGAGVLWGFTPCFGSWACSHSLANLTDFVNTSSSESRPKPYISIFTYFIVFPSLSSSISRISPVSPDIFTAIPCGLNPFITAINNSNLTVFSTSFPSHLFPTINLPTGDFLQCIPIQKSPVGVSRMLSGYLE
ncbi:hypothetical protein Bca101_039535 [Brassica carinata]